MPNKRGPKDTLYEHARHIAEGGDSDSYGPDGWAKDIGNPALISNIMPNQNGPGSMAGGGTRINITKLGKGMKGPAKGV